MITNAPSFRSGAALSGQGAAAAVRIALLALVCIVVAGIAAGGGRRSSAIGLPPQVDQPIVATFATGALTLTGTDLGLPTSVRSIRFDYNGTSQSLGSGSPRVQSWGATQIQFTLPPGVQDGILTVIVDGVSSNAVALRVYVLTITPTTVTTTDTSRPLAVAVGPDSNAWVIDEFNHRVKSFTNAQPSVATARVVPQAAGPGIFANNIGVDARSPVSGLGEDISVQSDGSVWFTQGGATIYSGTNRNTSRIVEFQPATSTFTCYNLPVDSAEVNAVLLDRASGMAWYSEGSIYRGNAITGFHLDSATADCFWDPDTGTRPPLCSVQQTPDCHARYVLPHPNSLPGHLAFDAAGNIWFTEFWGNRIGRLNPTTGVITELPLPAPIARQGPGFALTSGGPWTILPDDAGNFWISEGFDAQIDRLTPSRMSTSNCTQLDIQGHNPCIDEMYTGSNGLDGNGVHTLWFGADGFVWFTRSGESSVTLFKSPLNNPAHGEVGFIATHQNNSVVILPTLPNVKDLAGITQDPVTRDVWFAEYSDRKLGRLQSASVDPDGDGIPSATDNCPNVYNPDQANRDGEFTDLHVYGKTFDDLTQPNSDRLGDACDPDADNDGLPNSVESSLGPGGASHAQCPSASANTDPLKLDTDGDGFTDRGECLIGTDPANPNSKPPTNYASGDADHDGLPDALELQIGTDPNKVDSDGDGVSDGVEVLRFGTDPLNADTDADGCPDGKEIASVDSNRVVGASDLGLIAQAVQRGAAGYIRDFDQNRDGVINSLDLALAARQFGYCPAL